jgi:hypothetical protein
LSQADGRDPALEQLLSEQAIRRLVLAYADAFLVRDDEAMMSLWAPVDPPYAPPRLDASWARSLVARWHSLGTTVLHVTNHLIWLEDERHARGRVFCLAQLDRGEAFVDQSIVYEDRYVDAGSGWRFECRDHLLWFGTVRPTHPMEQARADWPRSQIGRGTLPEDLPGLAKS